MAYKGIPEFLLSKHAEITRLELQRQSLEALFANPSLKKLKWSFAKNEIIKGSLVSRNAKDELHISCTFFGGLELHFPLNYQQREALTKYELIAIDWSLFEELKHLDKVSVIHLCDFISSSKENQKAFVALMQEQVDTDFTESTFYDDFRHWEETVIEQEALQTSLATKDTPRRKTVKI